MKLFQAVLFGIGVFVVAVAMIAAGIWYAGQQWIAEDRGRMAHQEKQLDHDKRLLLKVPNLYKGRAVEDCQIVRDEVQCIYHNKQGELKMLAAQ